MLNICYGANDMRKEERDSDPMLLRDILSGVIQDKRKTKAHKVLKNVQIFQAWEKAAGVFIQKHTAPSNFYCKKLYIGVNHPSWKVELQFKKEELLEKINKELGKCIVKDIVFYLLQRPKSSNVD